MKGKRFVLGLLLAFVVSFALPGVVSADVNDFTVTNFAADYYLTSTDPQGQMRVVEKISVDFSDNNHGILRALPESYQNHPLKLHVDKVSSDSDAPAQFTTYESSGNEVLKIGDPNRTVTGAQEYTVEYTEQNVISFYKDHDELYWNVNGNLWDQPFALVAATVHLPTGLKLWSQAVCYTGSSAGDRAAQACSITQNGYEINTSASDLTPGSTLTFVAGFQKGYFHPMTWRDYVHDYGAQALEFLLPLLLLGGGGFVWWLKRGRDAKGRGVIIPEYDVPDGLSPLEVGSLIDFVVDDRDLTATIIDLAIRGYIKIIEIDGKKLLVIKNKSYMLELRKNDLSGLNTWDQQLLAGIFGDLEVGHQVDITALATKLSSEAKSIKKSVESSLTYRGYFKSNPAKYAALSIGAFVIFGYVLIAVFGNVLPHWFLAGAFIGAVIFAIFYHFMSARTAKGVAAKEHILGLKMYLEVAEKDRIAKLQSPDAPYAEKSGGPKRTVDLFEKLLPYAIVLKVEEQWAGKFKDIYKSQPDWYSGNFVAFNAGYLAGSLGGGFQSAMNSSFSPPRSSGSSGFGSGGFAGGGGGGGGGGGW